MSLLVKYWSSIQFV